MTRQETMRQVALPLIAAFGAPTAMASAGAFIYIVPLAVLAALVATKGPEILGRKRGVLIVGTIVTTLLGIVSFFAWGTRTPMPVLAMQLLWASYVIALSAKLVYDSIEVQRDAGE